MKRTKPKRPSKPSGWALSNPSTPREELRYSNAIQYRINLLSNRHGNPWIVKALQVICRSHVNLQTEGFLNEAKSSRQLWPNCGGTNLAHSRFVLTLWYNIGDLLMRRNIAFAIAQMLYQSIGLTNGAN